MVSKARESALCASDFGFHEGVDKVMEAASKR